jgi:hypothetical protein
MMRDADRGEWPFAPTTKFKFILGVGTIQEKMYTLHGHKLSF